MAIPGFSYTTCPECGEDVGYVLGTGSTVSTCSECGESFDRRGDK